MASKWGLAVPLLLGMVSSLPLRAEITWIRVCPVASLGYDSGTRMYIVKGTDPGGFPVNVTTSDLQVARYTYYVMCQGQ